VRLLVTGAAGFLGRYVVAEALQRGHRVRALDRPESQTLRLPWSRNASVELMGIDLSAPSSLCDALRGVDAVIHLAAAKEGSFELQYSGTVLGTSKLLDAMRSTGVLRLVLIGSFSVFDYLHIADDETVDEGTPLEQDPIQRDSYARTKLMQEEMVREFERDQDGRVSILRLGVAYGWAHLWTPRLGVALRPNLWLRIGGRAQIPLSYVENCAEAIVRAAERDEAVGRTLHIVDDDSPTQRAYADAVAGRMLPRPRTIPVSWVLMRVLARLAWGIDTRLLGSRVALPSVLVPARLHARFKPLRYSNQRAKRTLDWSPRYSLAAALDRSCGSIDPLETASGSVAEPAAGDRAG
jgi:nucleoside-diphosphate-sugar epimerase